MAKRKRRAAKKRKVEWSKVVCLLAMLAGLLIVQECLFLMYLCIKSGYTAAAAWLTAATGVGEAIIIAGANGYLSLAKSDHKRGGITFEAAKAKNFQTDTEDDGIMKAPSQDFTSCRGGFFCFLALSHFRGAVALFLFLVGVYTPAAQRACCNSPTAARGRFLRWCASGFSERPCISLGNELNDRSLGDGVARLSIKGVALLRADIGRSAPAWVDIDIEPTVALVDRAIPAVAATVLQPKPRRGAELLIAHMACGFHRGAGGSQFFRSPRLTHAFLLLRPCASSPARW
mgnify:CR=1 FL=1